MTMTAAQYGLVASGIAQVMQARNRRRRVLVITDEPRLRRAFYERSRPAGGFAGFYQTLCNDGVPAPFTRSVSAPANLSKGPVAWPYRHDFQPNIGGGGSQAGVFVYDTTATALDGTTGLEAFFVPNGFQELRCAAGADVTADTEIMSIALDGAYTQVKSPDWYKAALTVRVIMHQPAANATGANPIVGGMTFKAGTRRGAAGYTLGTAAAASTTAGMVSATHTLAAAAGLPSVSLNAGAAATNRGRRGIPVGVHIVNDATTGLELVVVDNPFQNIHGFGLDSNAEGISSPAWTGLISALGGGFDAVVLHMCANIAASFANNSSVDDLGSLAAGVPPPADSYTESVNDFIVGKLLSEGIIAAGTPICILDSWFYGQVADAFSAGNCSLTIGNTIRRSFVVDHVYNIDHPGDTKYGIPRCGLVNFYDNGGSDGPSSPTTQNTILTGSGASKLINVNGSGAWGAGTVRGAWVANHAYVQGDVVFINLAVSGDNITATGGVPWYVCNTNHTSTAGKVSVVDDAANTAKWTALDFRPTDTLANAFVDFFWTQIETAEKAAAAAGSNFLLALDD